MVGYNWAYGMSNNAVAAYESGQKPLSKWTKSGILGELKGRCIYDDIQFPQELEKLSKRTLQNVFLKNTSWHHTSSAYNETYFYDIRADYAEKMKDVDKLLKLDEEYRTEKEEEKQKEEETQFAGYVEATFEESVKHGRRFVYNTYTAFGVVDKKGWLHLATKSVTGKSKKHYYNVVKSYKTLRTIPKQHHEALKKLRSEIYA